MRALRHGLVGAALALSLFAPALSQTSATQGVVLRSRESSTNNSAVVLVPGQGDAVPGAGKPQANGVVLLTPSGAPYTAAGGGGTQASPTVTQQPTVSTTATPYTGSATANAFTTALAANGVRKDCTIYSASAFSVAPGASPAANIAIPVQAGGTFKCSDAAVVMGDQINVASATASAAYVIWSQ